MAVDNLVPHAASVTSIFLAMLDWDDWAGARAWTAVHVDLLSPSMLAGALLTLCRSLADAAAVLLLSGSHRVLTEDSEDSPPNRKKLGCC